MTRLDAAIALWAQSSGNDTAARADAYDSLCWALVTSSGEELKGFCRKYWTAFGSLPTPLIVLAARLLANCYRDDLEVVNECKNIIALYCDPIEEQHATAGL